MPSVLDKLVQTFSQAVQDAYPDVPDTPIDVSLSPRFGDYQCNSALKISQLLKGQG